MKKLMVFVMCLVWLAGCVPVPAYAPQPSEAQVPTDADAAPEAPAATAAPEITAAPTATAAPTEVPEPVATPLPVPGVTREPVLAATPTPRPTVIPTPELTPTPKPTPVPTPKPTATRKPTATPKPTATRKPTPTPKPTAAPNQTYSGTYFRFEAPGSWSKAAVPDGAYFYPDARDTRHTFLLYKEAPNDMDLTETKLDLALMFSSRATITSMVEEALTSNGMTGFTLSPMTVKKTSLNGVTCYKGASDIVLDGETYDFVGHIFLRGKKMVLLIWVGDEAKNAAGLKTIYDSLQALR